MSRRLPCGASRTGEWVYYHTGGSIRARGHYGNDLEDGSWAFLYPTGGSERVGQYDAGEMSGPWTHFHPNGRPAADGFMHRNRQIGPWHLWTESGELAQRAFPLPDGATLMLERWPNGLLRRQGVVEHGQPVGRWTSWHANGNLRFCCTRTGPHLSGFFEARLADGALLANGLLDDSRPHEARVVDNGNEREARTTPWPTPRKAWSVEGKEPELRPEDVLASWLAEQTLSTDGMIEWSQLITPIPSELSVLQRAEIEDYVRMYQDDSRTRPSLQAFDLGVRDEMARLADAQARSEEASLCADLQARLSGVAPLRCADGAEFDLRGLGGRKRLLVVVLRAFLGEVCVYCHAQTEVISKQRQRLVDLGVEVVVVYPGAKENAGDFAKSYATTFADSPPPYHAYFDADAHLLGQLRVEFTQAATILIDAQGIVQHASISKRSSDRPIAKELGLLIDSLDR